MQLNSINPILVFSVTISKNFEIIGTDSDNDAVFLKSSTVLNIKLCQDYWLIKVVELSPPHTAV